MPRLPKGMARFTHRPGYYWRDQRGGKNGTTKLTRCSDVGFKHADNPRRRGRS